MSRMSPCWLTSAARTAPGACWSRTACANARCKGSAGGAAALIGKPLGSARCSRIQSGLQHAVWYWGCACCDARTADSGARRGRVLDGMTQHGVSPRTVSVRLSAANERLSASRASGMPDGWSVAFAVLLHAGDAGRSPDIPACRGFRCSILILSRRAGCVRSPRGVWGMGTLHFVRLGQFFWVACLPVWDFCLLGRRACWRLATAWCCALASWSLVVVVGRRILSLLRSTSSPCWHVVHVGSGYRSVSGDGSCPPLQVLLGRACDCGWSCVKVLLARFEGLWC